MEIAYPSTYRHDFLARIAKLILRGESVLLIGPAGIGKTSDTQLLLRNEETKKTYFPNSNFSYVWLNSDEMFEANQKVYIDEVLNLPKTNADHFFIVIDHADRLINRNFEMLLSTIRSVRESTRPKTAVIFLSSQQISLPPVDSLLLENPIIVPPLSPEDSAISLKLWERYYETKIPAKDSKQILESAGGIPRLIKRLVKLAADNVSISKTLENPLLDQKLQVDLSKLTEFNRDNPENAYKSPLLLNFQEQSNTNFDIIGQVKFFRRLSKQEYDLAKFLIDNQNKFVSREDMVKAIWPNNLYETSEHALDQMIHRLRKKMETATPKCNLATIRGRGVKLTL